MKANVLRMILMTTTLSLISIQAENAAGSIFSGLGYGVLEQTSSTRAAGMGNAGLALRDSLGINGLNPASFADLNHTQISVGGYMQQSWMRDAQSQDNLGGAQFEYFGLSVSFKRGLSLGFFLSPYSRMDYQYGWQGSLSGVPYFESFTGCGGLSRAALNLAWQLTPWGQVGLAGSVIWGNVEKVRGSYFEASGYSDVEFTTSEQWMAFGGTLGILVNPTPDLTLGAIIEPEIPLHLDQSYTYTNEDSTISTEVDYRLAGRYGLGLSWRLRPTWLATGQVIYGNWENLINLPSGTTYQNSLDVSVGGEYSPGDWKAERFFNRLQYRFGGRWESGYAQSDAQPVHGYFATVGLGYPLQQGQHRLDFAIELGQRGSLSENSGTETILKFRAGLTLGESWFQRPKPTWGD